jgi:hypothetical protein
VSGTDASSHAPKKIRNRNASIKKQIEVLPRNVPIESPAGHSPASMASLHVNQCCISVVDAIHDLSESVGRQEDIYQFVSAALELAEDSLPCTET